MPASSTSRPENSPPASCAFRASRGRLGRNAAIRAKTRALIAKLIGCASDEGDLVLDPFLGSGTTAVVAERLHRRWLGIELDPRYVELARQRLGLAR